MALRIQRAERTVADESDSLREHGNLMPHAQDFFLAPARLSQAGLFRNEQGQRAEERCPNQEREACHRNNVACGRTKDQGGARHRQEETRLRFGGDDDGVDEGVVGCLARGGGRAFRTGKGKIK